MPPAFHWPVRIYYRRHRCRWHRVLRQLPEVFRARPHRVAARHAAVNQQALAEQDGAIFVVKNASIDYHAPAKLDDVLNLTLSIEKLGRASVQFVQQAWRGDVLLASASVKVGCVDAATLRPRSLPPATADKMRAA
ncbi:acyl-CoA thioesterase [Massilia sp. B-10]|nr:acyl-CoA thioesterase [Massilia sp. B-10]